MQCARIWSGSIASMGVLGIAMMLTNESAAQSAYRAGRSERSLTLTPGDSDGGSRSRAVQPWQYQPRNTIQVQPRPTTQYPGALRRQPQAATTWFNGGAYSGRQTSNWTLGGERWQPLTFNNNGINGAALGRRNVARIENELRSLYQLRQVARIRYEHGGGYARDLNDYRALDRRIRQLESARMSWLRYN